jgi:phosphate transport system permease protein
MKSRRRWTRKIGNWIGWSVAWLAAALVLFALSNMVFTILIKGIQSFRWDMLFQVTAGNAGGLQNAILGTFLLIALSTVVAAPLGVLGGIYASEFSGTRLASVIRFFTEVLSGVPSIVIGYFGYLFMVLELGWGFSALAGAIALTIIMLPYILRSTEASLQQVPWTLREAAWGMGMTQFQAVAKVIWRPAASGIATGILMAIAIGLGETAPLLYTAGWSQENPTLQLINHQVGYLTYVVWTYIDMPYPESHELAYAAAFVLTMTILFIHLVVRTAIKRVLVRE